MGSHYILCNVDERCQGLDSVLTDFVCGLVVSNCIWRLICFYTRKKMLCE